MSDLKIYEGHLQIFENNEFGQVRMVEIKGKLYAVGVDVTRALEYANPSKAVMDHCKGDFLTWKVTDNLGRLQDTRLIPEGDIYRLIVKAADQSKNPGIKAKAERFERWIFDDVLPTLRKTGGYVIQGREEEFIDKYFPVLSEETKKAMVKDLQKSVKEMQRQLERQKPFVEFAENCMASENSILVRELAKIATKQGIITGEKRLYQKLREWGLIIKGTTEPTQRAMERGYFEVVEGVRETSKGTFTYRTTRVTGKGQIYIINRLREEQREIV
ncbi:MAG: phage antirepressor KilAC domain-containing protein [Archaeoglobus sp.]|nr:phage antirepressor KilAC domain-containing protein [Archaeoglobus sp.]